MLAQSKDLLHFATAALDGASGHGQGLPVDDKSGVIRWASRHGVVSTRSGGLGDPLLSAPQSIQRVSPSGAVAAA